LVIIVNIYIKKVIFSALELFWNEFYVYFQSEVLRHVYGLSLHCNATLLLSVY